jgi:hypothetical protein
MRKRLMMTILAGLMGVISPVMLQSTTATIRVAASGTNGLSCSTGFESGTFLDQGWIFSGPGRESEFRQRGPCEKNLPSQP